MAKASEVINEIEQRVSDALSGFLTGLAEGHSDYMPVSWPPLDGQVYTAHQFNAQTVVAEYKRLMGEMRHDIGYGALDKRVLRLNEVERSRMHKALDLARTKLNAFFDGQLATMHAAIADKRRGYNPDADQTEYHKVNGAVITTITNLWRQQAEALFELRKEVAPAAQAVVKAVVGSRAALLAPGAAGSGDVSPSVQSYGAADAAFAPTVVHSHHHHHHYYGGGGYYGYQGDSFFDWWMYNDGFNAGLSGNDPSYFFYFGSRGYGNGYAEGSLVRFVGNDVLPFVGRGVVELFQWSVQGAEVVGRGVGHVGSAAIHSLEHIGSQVLNFGGGLANDLGGLVVNAAQGVAHLAEAAADGCCDVVQVTAHCCEGAAGSVAHGAGDCVGVVGHGCAECGSGVCECLSAVGGGVGDCAKGMTDCGDGLGECCSACCSIIGAGIMGIVHLITGGGSDDSDADSDSDGSHAANHSIGSATATTNDGSNADILNGQFLLVWGAGMAILSLMILRNTAIAANNIYKHHGNDARDTKRDQKRLAAMWSVGLITGALGFFGRLHFEDKTVGGPRTGLGFGLALSLAAFYVRKLIDTKHSRNAYGSRNFERDYLKTAAIERTADNVQPHLSVVMQALQTASESVKQQDTACFTARWAKAKLWQYTGNPTYDALKVARENVRAGEYGQALTDIETIGDGSRYGIKREVAVLLEQLTEMRNVSVVGMDMA